MDSTILRVGESGEFVLKRAVTGEDRLRCWNLVYREYLDMGYAQPNRLAYRYSVATLWPKMPGWSLAFPGHGNFQRKIRHVSSHVGQGRERLHKHQGG